MSETPTIRCRTDDQRRGLARAKKLNGFDYVEVSCDQTTLDVYFLGKAPDWDITPRHLRIDGGQRIRGIRVLDVEVERTDDDDIDDVMHVTVDRAGDFSTYTLCLSALDADSGRATHSPPADFDPRYACVCFSFKAACGSDLDCLPAPLCEPKRLPEPVIDYLAKDYASFRRLILDRMALLLPDWKERHVPDFGITLVELLAYVGDQLSYYQDAVATEAYLDTARLRVSVRRHARLVDYLLHEGCNARSWVVIETSQDYSFHRADVCFITGAPASDGKLRAEELPQSTPEPWLVFEPLLSDATDQIDLYRHHNEIGFYTWNEGECCIPQGATSATLLDPGAGDNYLLRLAPCDVLLFEEVLGPRTIERADADRSHRHAVRLTKVTPGRDPLTGALIVDIEWCPEDALPFPLCISVIGPPPLCLPTTNVSIARGNVVLVDHGKTVFKDLCAVTGRESAPVCADDCAPAETTTTPDRYYPHLPPGDVTHAETVARCGSGKRRCEEECATTAASVQLRQDSRKARPLVWLRSAPAHADDAQPRHEWVARGDLLDSGPEDRHFVVETDDERVAHLRFGDGDCGRQPDVGETFRARYRVGNGVAGNVGADAITRIVFSNNYPSAVTLSVRNPLAAQGGMAPEPVKEAKLRAPFLFRNRLERAIIAEDYAAIVERDFAGVVQRAAAVLRWNGTGPDVIVAVDASGTAEPAEALLRRIERHLRDYRRIGHDVHVVPARHVPLDLALTVCVAPHYLRGHVKSAVLAALGSRRLAGGRLGFFHADNLTFGGGVFLSRIVATVQALEGVESVVVTKLERLDQGPNGELEAGVLPLGPMEVARLDVDPDYPENGVLTVTLRGGR